MATGGPGSGTITPHHRRQVRRALAHLKARQPRASTSGSDTPGPHSYRRPATPIVTEHTRGQAHPARDTRGFRDFLPADYGQSLSPPRSTRRQVAAYRRVHTQPFGSAGHMLSQLAILAGSLDRVQPPQQQGRRVKTSGLDEPQLLAVGRSLGQSVAQDFTDPRHHKLNLALDALAILSGGAGAASRTTAATRAYREATAGERAASAAEAFARRPTPADLPRRLLPDQTGLRRLRVDGGSIQVPGQSPNLLTAAAQHVADRLSELIPDTAVVGAKSRAARHITEANTRRLHRLTAEAIPLENAARPLRSRRGVTPQQMAYTAVARGGQIGEEGGRLVDLEIAQKAADAATKTGRARKRLSKRIQLLQAARPHVVNPSPELRRALEEGGHLSTDVTTASRVQRGLFTQETADQAASRHIRTIHGAEFETPTPGKLGVETPGLKRDRARVESLQRRYEKAVEDADKAGVVPKVAGVKSEGEITREDALAEHIALHRQTLRSVPKGSDTKLQGRLDEINKRWDSFVESIGGGKGKYKGVNADEQRRINQASRKRGRVVLSDELRKQKEQIALEFVEKNQHVPVVQRVKAQLEEGDRIQAELTARAERRSGFAAEGVLHPDKPTTAAALGHEISRLNQELKSLAARPGRIGTSVTTEGRLLHARGTAKIERLGAALSVARDRLEVSEAQAAGRVKPTGLVGAEDIKPGPHGFNTPDVEKPPLRASMSSKVSINPPRDRVHQSTMALFRQGREQVGPDVTIRDFQKEVRHIDRAERSKMAEQFAVPYDPAAFNQDEHMLLDPNAAKTARELRAEGSTATKAGIAAEKRSATAPDQEIDLQDVLNPAAQVRRLVKEHFAWSDKVFPKEVPAAAAAHETGLMMLDRKIGEAIAGNDVMQRMQSSLFGKAFDFSNQVNRAGLIYLNPVSYAIVQGTGNAGFLALQQGVHFLPNIPRYVKLNAKMATNDLHRVDIEVGGGAAAHLAHEGIGAGPLTRLADLDNLLADQYPRRFAWFNEAEREGFKTPAAMHELLTNKKLEEKLNVVSDRAQQAMVRFQRRPTWERKAIGRAIFIAPWVEGSTRWLFRLPLDRPLTARVANEIRDRILNRQLKAYGKYGHMITGSSIPVGKAFKKAGVPVIPGVDLQGASPFGTGVGTIRALGELGGLTGHPVKGGTRIAGALQPTLGAGITAFTRHDAYSGYDYPASRSIPSIFREQLVGNVDRPVFPLAANLRTAFAKPTDISGEKPSKMPLKYPEAGVGDALKRAVFGSARERLIVQPKLQAEARKARLQSMPMDKRVVAEVKDDFAGRLTQLHELGQYRDHKTWEPAYQHAINQRAQRKVSYVKQGADTAYKKLLVDLKLAVSHGMPSADARSDAAAFRGDTDGAVNAYRLVVQRKFLGQDAIDEISKALRDAKAAAGG